jgi:DNA invertase Pin-like site-specific DNA recombinase
VKSQGLSRQAGRSGLGLEGQQEALQRFAEANGFAFLETLTEVESGGQDHRPELTAPHRGCGFIFKVGG